MEAPLHQFPVPTPPLPLPLPQDALLQQQAVSARALMMAAAGGAENNKAPPLSAGPGREQCPRCASRDTKFCYFNNYNTAQPRQFCRACRRYWTLGGSLRNVPVGGSTRKHTRRPVRPTRAMAAAVMAMPLTTTTTTIGSDGGRPFVASPETTLLQGAGGGGFLLSSLLLGSASPLLALGAAPLLEGRLGFSDLGLGEVAALGAGAGGAAGDLAHHQTLPLGAGPLPWPAATTTTILEGDRAETTTWKDASGVFPFPSAGAALWQELAVAAPAVEAGGLRHGAASHLLL